MNKNEWKQAWRIARLPHVISLDVEIKDIDIRVNVRIAQKRLTKRFVLNGYILGGCLQMRLSTYKCKKEHEAKIAQHQTYLDKHYGDCIF